MNRFAKILETAHHQVLLQVGLAVIPGDCQCGHPLCAGLVLGMGLTITTHNDHAAMVLEVAKTEAPDKTEESTAYRTMQGFTLDDAATALCIMQEGGLGLLDAAQIREKCDELVASILARLTAQA